MPNNIYKSEKTTRGNVGHSIVSQEEADAQAAAMDAGGCTDCTDCTACTDCRNCTDCFGCSRCSYCFGCSRCNYCIGCNNCNNCVGCNNCNYCNDCNYCVGCNYCNDCHTSNYCNYCNHCSDCLSLTDCNDVLEWTGPAASHVLTLNGLEWPVATDGRMLQIGCQNHTVESWLSFSESALCKIAEGAVEFSRIHRDMIIGFVNARKEVQS